MTDKEKLNRLFEAALKDTSAGVKPLERAFPMKESAPVAAPTPIPAIVIAAIPAQTAPVSTQPLVVPMENAGLDVVTSTELAILLDEQNARVKRRHRREMVTFLAACLAIFGGGLGWFVHSPTRVQAFKDVIKEVRATGDIQGMVASYNKALEKISVRSTQIDQSTNAMGMSTKLKDGEDPNLNAEMKAMMGGEGKTTGERNKKLQEAFGKKIGNKATPTIPMPGEEGKVAKITKEDSFEWK